VAFNKKTVLAVIAVPPFLIGLFVVGLFVYMNATMRPLHSDPNGVPSVTYSPSVPKWADAIAQGRQFQLREP
jgi:hypothetical protein